MLRVAEPIDPHEARDADPVLCEFMNWATNVVRLPLKPGTADDLRQQMKDFPSAFLLFVEHVRQLTIDDGSTLERVLELENDDGEFRLIDGATAGKLEAVQGRPSAVERRQRRSQVARRRR